MVYSRISKRNNKQKLGRFNKELVIRLSKKNAQAKGIVYHLVLARRRSRAGCRYDKLGFFEVFKDKRKSYNILALNREKIKQALSLGASFHIACYKLIINS